MYLITGAYVARVIRRQSVVYNLINVEKSDNSLQSVFAFQESMIYLGSMMIVLPCALNKCDCMKSDQIRIPFHRELWIQMSTAGSHKLP